MSSLEAAIRVRAGARALGEGRSELDHACRDAPRVCPSGQIVPGSATCVRTAARAILGGMVGAEWLRGASFHEVWAGVIDPWLLASQREDGFAALNPAQRDLIRAWLLHGVACRSGLG